MVSLSAREAYLALVAAVAVERGVELVVSRRHERALAARGAIERGRGHYPAMVLLHAGTLAGCAAGALLRPVPPPWALGAAAAVLGAEGLRWWAVATLGERWTTRVLVLPDAPPITGGPYRILRHPNYLAVVVELAALPLAWGLLGLSLLASVANVAVLAIRIRAEERALGPAWASAFERTPRFLPVRRGTSPRPTVEPKGSRDAPRPARGGEPGTGNTA
jgi:methyltransferase